MHKEAGYQAAKTYYTSQFHASYTRHVRAEDAAKLFLPPVAEMLVQMETPLPKPRQEWIAGFKQYQKEHKL